jgi:rhodanese-related sulfurtransferase
MPESTVENTAPQSLVEEFPVEDREEALAHFRRKLSLATDPSDVRADLISGRAGFVVVDARSTEAYARGHVPGAMSLPYRTIDGFTTASIPRETTVVTYCDGIGCNASTKAALKLTALGFRVKEMLGGFEWWQRDGYPAVVGNEPVQLGPAPRCGC